MTDEQIREWRDDAERFSYEDARDTQILALADEVLLLRRQRDVLQARCTELVEERRAAVVERNEARGVARALLDAIEILAERAANIGWIDKDQYVEAAIDRARAVLGELAP